MRTGNNCSVCGKLISSGFICEDCEKEILERGRGKRYVLTLLTTLLLVFILIFMWGYYKTSEAEFVKVKSNYGLLLSIMASIAKSPVLILVGVAILFTVFYHFSTRSARAKR